jgi:hypothetical protein
MGFGMKEYSVDNTTEHPLRNSLLIISGIALLLAALVIFVKEFVLVDGSRRYEYAKHNWKQIDMSDDHLDLISKDGTVYNYKVSDDWVYDMESSGRQDDFIVDTSGDFTLYYNITWHKDTLSYSLLTGYIVTTETGSVVYTWYGLDPSTEKKIHLNEGNYILKRCYIANENDLKKFCSYCNLPYEEGKYQFPTDAEWKATDNCGIKKE